MSGSLLSPGDRLKARFIGAAGYPVIAALCRTLTYRVEGGSHFDAIVAAGHQPILALWHGRILAGLHYFRDRGVVVMTSRNFDGEWIAAILTRFGFATARGSTSRGAARALVQLRRALTARRAVAFTVDGPRGPARVAQPGALWLAGATGHPVLPFHIEAARFWEAASWDRTQIPRPFTTVALVIGPPLSVPDTAAGTVEEKRRELEAALASLESRAREMLIGAPSTS
jgi:lysophospholipid acyltransferase (LPLAT)-like uncharacterized protein